MIEIRDKKLIMAGRPTLMISAEVHYFRLTRTEWADRVEAARAAGATAIASYIPWIFHELPDGDIDVTGRSRPERDVGAFIDLCHDHGLSFIARPGPFVMAELKNEGLPFRLYEQHPEIVPIGWDGVTAPTRTVDYLAPAFLREVSRWYDAIMPVLAARLEPGGGNVIGVQLDNEVGMLAWASNSPDLTDTLLDDLVRWLEDRYGKAESGRRYPFLAGWAPEWRSRLRSPDEEFAAALRVDLGHFMRHRFADYFTTLRRFAERNGVVDVPFLINIHGTEAGRGSTFPIGISQLFPSYSGVPGVVSGSDIYLGEPTAGNVSDLYLVNAFMDAVHDDDQPLTSLEFEAGSGDYGDDLSMRFDRSAVDIKTRLCIAQGNRLINYYLFSGGRNPRLDEAVGDGNDRLGFTGERHGFAAPVGPEGQRGPAYRAAADAIGAAMGVAGCLGGMRPEFDNVAIGFVPDHFMTEYTYPGSAVMRAVADNLRTYRGGGARQVLGRSMVLGGFRFPAIDIQHRTLDPTDLPVLALASAAYLDSAVQKRLVAYLRAGGHLLTFGQLPTHDLQARPCTVLIDALGLRPHGERVSTSSFFVSVCAAGWAAPRPEVRVSTAQLFDADHGEQILYDYGSRVGCGFDVRVGEGRAIAVTTDYFSDLAFYREALERLGARRELTHDTAEPGLLLSSTVDDDGGRLIHAINLTGDTTSTRMAMGGETLFGGEPVELPDRRGAMLPVGLILGGVRIAWATAEIAGSTRDSVVFRLTGARCSIVLDGARPVDVPAPAHVYVENGRTVIRADAHDFPDHRLVVRLMPDSPPAKDGS